MNPFTFVHAADLHLGSPFKGLSARLPRAMARMQTATFDAFDALVTLCIEKQAAFLLVAGDVFDDARRSLRAQLVFRDGLEKLSDKGIHTYVVRGNHDPEEAWAKRISWPPRTHFFSSETVETKILEINGTPTVAVSGISYPNRNETRRLAAQFRADHRALFQIGLLHTSCGDDPNHSTYAPTTPSALSAVGLDYWALGHVHARAVLSERPHIVYPGNIQGLHIRETGPRGCYVVSVDAAGRPALDFMPLDALRWVSATVDVTDMETLDDLDKALTRRIAAIGSAGDGRGAIARVALSGRSELYRALRKEETLETLLSRARDVGAAGTPPVWIQDFRIACRPVLDGTRSGNTDAFPGQVLREVAALQRAAGSPRGAGALLPEALTAALGPLYTPYRLAQWLPPLSDDEQERLLQEVERLCLDLLEPDE